MKVLLSEYKEALRFTKSRYENFPVVSLFIPKELRKHIAVVYQFARQADDIAEGRIKILEMEFNRFYLQLNFHRNK